jgi:hypothetical protein
MISRILSGGVFGIAWFGIGIFQMTAILAGIDVWVDGWLFSFLLWLVVVWIPIPFLCEALAFYGAYAAWHWHWYWALAFAAPGLVLALISTGPLPIVLLADKFKRNAA